MDSTARSATRPAVRSIDRLGAFLTPAGWLVLVAGLAGCSGVEPVAPHHNLITDPTKLYTQLTLDYRVLTLSTDITCHCATWQLTATPRDALGGAMKGLPVPTFSLLSPSDTNTVRVTADGMVTALQTGMTKILAELTVDGVRRTDTAFIAVENPVPVPTLASVSIDPLLPDSAIRPQASFNPPGDINLFTFAYLALVFSGTMVGSNNLPLPSPRVLNTLGRA